MEQPYESLFKFRATYANGTETEFTSVDGNEQSYAKWRGELRGSKLISVTKIGPAFKQDSEF